MQQRFALLLAGALALAAGAAPCQTFVRRIPDLPSISPISVAVDPAGNLWTANANVVGLTKLSPTGQELLQVPRQFRAPAGGPFSLQIPLGIAVNAAGVYVADGNYVLRFDHAGQFVSWFGGPGTGPGQMTQAGGIATNASTGDIYVTDIVADRVLRFGSDGTFLGQFGAPGSSPGEFHFLAGTYVSWFTSAAIAVDTAGEVLVIDSGNSRVQRFTADGTPLSQFAVPPFYVFTSGSTQYYDRASLALEPGGSVYVGRAAGVAVPRLIEYTAYGTQIATASPNAYCLAATGSHQVAVGNQQNLEVWSTVGGAATRTQTFGNLASSVDGLFARPVGIEYLPSGELLVADTSKRVQRFDGTAVYQDKVTLQARTLPAGAGANSLNTISLLTMDSGGNHYGFAQQREPLPAGGYDYRYAVHKWSPTGAWLQTFGMRDEAASFPSTPPAAGQYGWVVGLVADEAGGVWISDYQWHRLLHYDASGALVATIGTQGASPGQFQNPWGLCRAANGDLLVCDRSNGRIQRLDSAGNYLSHFPCSGPESITISSDQSRIYVGTSSTFKVVVFNGTGGRLASLGSYGAAPGQLSDAPGVACHGNLLAVAEYLNNRVSVFDVSLLDQQVPVVTITSPTPISAFDGVVITGNSVAVAAQITDASPTTVQSSPANIYALLPAGGGGVGGTFASPHTGSSDTAFSISINALDISGNSGGASILVKRDVNAPTNWGVSYADNTVVGTSSISLSFQVYDFTSKTVTVSHGGGTHFQGGSGYISRLVTVSGLLNGPNTITLTATDAIGHVSTYTRTIIADLTAPIVEFVGLGGPTDPDCFGPGQSLLPVTVQVTDIAATYLTSTPFASWGGWLLQGGDTRTANISLVQGLNTITVRAQDQYGRQSSVSTTVLYDLTAPTATFDAPTVNQLVRGSMHVLVDASDPLPNTTPGCGVASVALAIDGNAIGMPWTEEPYELDLDTTSLADGAHTLTAVVTDGVGNVRTISVPFVTDNTAPTVNITAPVANAIVGGNDLPFTATASDANGLASISMQAGTGAPNDTDGSTTFATPVANASVSSVYDTIPLADGSLLLRVTARDAAGNEATAEATVVVDNTAPEKALVSPTDGATVTGVVPIVATANDPNLTSLVIKVDGNVVGSTSSSSLTVNFDTVARGEGPMTIEVIVTDAANNTSSCTATVNVVNLTYDFDPDTLSLKNKGQGVVTAHLEGPTVANLLPVAAHRIELRVQGGNSVSALGAGGVGDSDADLVPDMTIRFDRATLINSIKAGILGSFLPADGMIAIELWIDGHRAGSSPVRIKS